MKNWQKLTEQLYKEIDYITDSKNPFDVEATHVQLDKIKIEVENLLAHIELAQDEL